MKKLIIGILIIVGVFALWNGLSHDNNQPAVQTDTITSNKPLPDSWPPENSIAVPYNNQTYRVYFYPIGNMSENVSLIANYDSKLSANALVNTQSCKAAINGGFYEQDGSPLGMIRVNGKTLSPAITSTNLLTGFVWIDDSGLDISRVYPDSAPTVLQTGPMISNSEPLSLVSDKQARRSAIVQDARGVVYIVAVTFDDVTTSGPFLKDLPPILFSENLPFDTADAINLDGGAASYYYIKDDVELLEYASIGSLFCVT